MKTNRIITGVFCLLCLTVFTHAEVHLGINSAVKKQARKLKEKIEEEQAKANQIAQANTLPLFTQAVGGNWVQTQFVIGTCWDPMLRNIALDYTNTTAVAKDTASFQKAKDAYFNLLTGIQEDRWGIVYTNGSSYTSDGMDYALKIAYDVGIKYLVADNRTSSAGFFNTGYAQTNISHYKALDGTNPNLRAAMYGYFIADEPDDLGTSITAVKEWIFNIKSSDSSKLAYFNLFPRYWINLPLPDGDTRYANYLDNFLNDPIANKKPDVVSFDHYPFLDTGVFRPDYFYNLRVFREKTLPPDGRPFWAYPYTYKADGLLDPDANKLRFMAFSPLAYGAKGLIYYVYQYPRKDRRWRIYLNNGNPGARFNDPDPEINRDHFDAPYDYECVADYNGDHMADLSVKTKDGNWLIDYAEKINGKLVYSSGWDEIQRDYGLNWAHPVPADFDGDGKADLSVKADNGDWFINYSNDGFSDGWDIIHHDFGLSWSHAVPADYDGDVSPSGHHIADLSVKTDTGAWYINYSGNGFASGWDVIKYFPEFVGTTTTASAVPADYDGDGKADMAVKRSDGIWAIAYSSDPSGKFSRVINYPGWGEPTCVTRTGYDVSHPIPADYNGDGSADLAIKNDETGYVKIVFANPNVSLENRYSGNVEFYGAGGFAGAGQHAVPADYNGDGKVDLAVKWEPGIDSVPAIVDENGNPTAKYAMVKENNRYITEVVGPVIMSCTSLGAYHRAATPAGVRLSNQELQGGASIMNNDWALCGIFQDKVDLTLYYFLVVNKNLSPINNLTFTNLSGNYDVSIAPSVVGYNGGTAYSPLAKTYISNITSFTISTLAGGEGRMIKLKKLN